MSYTRAKRLIKGLECCSGNSKALCLQCPFYGHDYDCFKELMSRTKDYIEKNSEPYEPTPDYKSDYDRFLCGNCGRLVIPIFRCCPQCGEEIDWYHAIGYEYKQYRDKAEEIESYDDSGDEDFD